VADTEYNPERFACLLRDIMGHARLSEEDIGRLARRHRSQVNQWLHGRHRPGYDAAVILTTTLRQRYPGLGTRPAELLAAAGYDEPSTAKDSTPIGAGGGFVDLGDPNERLLWQLDAPEDLRRVLVAFFRTLTSPEGVAAVRRSYSDGDAEQNGQPQRCA
jgi:transcriptional regulator with XRE-family HTH domain